MSIALYRKYRPQAFGDVTNQNHIKLTLQNEIESDKIGHAYLFCGPRGTGKTTLARIFSKTVNCLDKKNNNEPCNGCDSCNEINDGKSMDIIEIDAASHTGVDNVRENIISNARFTPTSRKYKVFIIDEVHMLSISAFNALLKILEEPPQYVIFILATTEIHKVPNTIISRCQRFDFKKIIFNELVDRLRWICTQEGVSVDEKVLSIIAKTANGCVRDAESLLEQILSLGDKKITFEQAELIIPTNNFEILYQLFEYIVKNQTKEAIEQINTIVIGGVDPMRFIDDFIEFTRKVLVYKINKQRENLAREVDESILGSLDKVIPGVTELRLSKIIKKFIDSKEQFKQSYIPQLALEIAVVDLTCDVGSAPVAPTVKVEAPNPAPVSTVAEKVVPEPAAVIPDKVETVDEPQKTVQEVASPEPTVDESVKEEVPAPVESDRVESAPVESAPVASGEPSDLLQVWPQIIDKLEKEHYKIYMSIRMSKLISIENNVVLLGFKFALQKNNIDEISNQSDLKAVIKEFTNQDVQIETTLDSTLNQSDFQNGTGSGQSEADSKPKDQVQDLADAFGGEVVEGV
ncbi:DNA polymerase III subunit gamma/tau [Candidatus Falkowbacteria bacterium]|nr:DNA polymerase III subunit gamma/tau [Candidatus Falkowbacteria bacterium]